MKREEKIRAAALALKVETEAFAARIAVLSDASDPAEVSALFADLKTSTDRAFGEMGELLGLTPAAVQLIRDESARLCRETGGNTSEDDIRNGRIGQLLAGLRAARSDEGGEA